MSEVLGIGTREVGTGYGIGGRGGGEGVRRGYGGEGSPHSKNSSLPDIHIYAGLENAAPCRYCCYTMPHLWETHPAPFCRL